MASPDWKKIPHDKLPEWKKQEMVATLKHQVEELESFNVENELKCDVCGKEAKNEHGLKIHKSKHK